MSHFPPLYQNFQVQYSYPVHFTEGVFDSDNPLLAKVVAGEFRNITKKVLLLVDEGLYQHHPNLLGQVENYCQVHQPQMVQAWEPLILPGGEEVKNSPEYVRAIHRTIEQAGLCRHSYVLAVGGGAVIDAAGYAAATAHRGLRLVRLPTTVMAQADASIGVKNGINAFGQKNFLGTFAPPWAVINDFHFLTTLSRRDWLSGVAEAVKVALIKDSGFFDFLEQNGPALVNRDQQRMQHVIHRCATLHLDHIARGGDPFESGSSRPLDFGHWAAHKLENLSRHQLRHGEAVAIGIALDATYAYLREILNCQDWQRILTLLARLQLPVSTPWLAQEEALLEGLEEFREHLGGPLTIIMLRGIGQPMEVHEMDIKLLAEALTLLQAQGTSAISQSGVLSQTLKSTRSISPVRSASSETINFPLS